MAITGKIQDAAVGRFVGNRGGAGFASRRNGIRWIERKPGHRRREAVAARQTVQVHGGGHARRGREIQGQVRHPALDPPPPTRGRTGERAEPKGGPPETSAPNPPPVAPAVAPANDDRRTVGELRQALQDAAQSAPSWARPSRRSSPGPHCGPCIVYLHQGEILDAEGGSFLAPKPVLDVLALFGPIVVFFVTGVMARRAHEMRLIANSMTEVAIRLIEPETVATEQVVALSQAIRREAASMGDGIERALARAGELEVIVRTEVTNLERSYSENERRIRLLVDELVREREAIMVNADNARTALFGARDKLSQELAATSAHLAEAVSEAGNARHLLARLQGRGDQARARATPATVSRRRWRAMAIRSSAS